MRDLSSPTRDRTCAPFNGSAESQPLGNQGIPLILFLMHKEEALVFLQYSSGFSRETKPSVYCEELTHIIMEPENLSS